MSPRLESEVSESVWRALQVERERTGDSMSAVLDRALSEHFELDRHSLFQVSTSNALVKGVFQGVTTVAQLKQHADFGLGTFAGLDGELVMVEGRCFRATAGGAVTLPADDAGVPFAVITRFTPDLRASAPAVGSVDDLTGFLDGVRPSENLFVALRVDGTFDALMMRAACPAAPGEGLLEATRHQSEFTKDGMAGSLVGFWSPPYTRAVTVPGYHFHFIADDRSVGGHVLDLRAGPLEVAVHLVTDVHLAIPETEEFLRADLSGEHAAALHEAETTAHSETIRRSD